MGSSNPEGCCGITRRGFLIGASAGLAAGAPLGWLGSRGLKAIRDKQSARRIFTGRSVEVPHVEFGMPGPFPGRVVEVRRPDAVSLDYDPKPAAVKAMIARGMKELTGADHIKEAWSRFFERGDVVGVKVNPVGRKGLGKNPSAIGAISSPAVILEVVDGLKNAGVRPQDIILFERYADEFRLTGYEALMNERALDGVRWYASSAQYDNDQLDIEGYGSFSRRRDYDPHVVGYDPDVFVEMGFAAQDQDSRDDRSFRSHLSVVVTRMVNKIVTIPVLKDHRSAGVTLSLKNLSHGMNNNVARSHLPTVSRLGGATSGPNQCNTFIPTAVSQLPTRQKATLHILDGLTGVYEGGPGCWNATWGTWRRKSLFFATDPVALDLVGWHIIDAKRAEEGWQPVAKMGVALNSQSPAQSFATSLTSLCARTTAELLSTANVASARPGSQAGENFDRRQPEHIILAGSLGLGVLDPNQIDHRAIHMNVTDKA